MRRAFLCGQDDFSGQSIEHRRQWIIDRIKELAGIFAIDVGGYAVMSNHYHVVLHVDRARASPWSADEVIERWRRLFRGHVLINRLAAGQAVTRAEREAASALIELWRARLYDIGWFMRCLNEHVARLANKEDDCKGRFWEGRYKSQALLDDAALLTCLSYVDLNPVRAGIAKTPGASDYTSIKERIQRLYDAQREAKTEDEDTPNTSSASLLPFDAGTTPDRPCIPFAFGDYLQLVDWTGRAIRNDKRGAIPMHFAPILQRLAIEPDQWLENVKFYNRRFHRALGASERIRQFAEALGQRWLKAACAAKRLHRTAPS